MELQILRDTFSAAGNPCTAKAEIPIETEILLSDYQPQVFKIVKCFAKMVVLQKQMQASRLILEGFFRCIVFYQEENGQGLCQTEQKIPFTKSLELPLSDYSICSIAVGGETEYLNCRAINRRRIEVRGAFEIAVVIHSQAQQEVICSVTECGAQQKSVLVSGVRCVSCMDKTISAETEFSFEHQPEMILELSGESTVRELRVLSGKAVVKGETLAEIVYRSANSELRTQRVAIPFNQILDAEGVTEECSCFCFAEAIGFTVAENNLTEGTNQLSASLQLHFRGYKNQENALTEDVFSTQYETNVSRTPLIVEQLEKKLEETVVVSLSGQIPDENMQLLACFATFGMPELGNSSEQTVLKARGVVTSFCKNSLEEIESYEKAVELNLPLEVDGDPQEYHLECWLTVTQISCAAKAGVLSADVTVRAEGLILKRSAFMRVSHISLGTAYEQEEPEVALRIYYAQSGEDVFEIARQFHVSPQQLRLVNQLNENSLDSTYRLLIPGQG